MNKLILQNKILYTILGILLLFPFALSAQELPRLEVVFTPDPLFSEDSVLPGDGVSGTVMVTNNSGESQTIITEAINVSDPDGLSDRMNVTITDDSANTFFDAGDGTFFDFLTGSILTLTDSLGDGESVEYTFEVSYLEGTGNAYQNTEFGFDLCVGFLDELSGINCGDTVVSGEGNTDESGEVSGDSGGAVGGSGGGGGGGIIDSTPLVISDEQVEELDTEVQTALIVWDTNQYATSQVVYGLASGGPYSLSLLTPNFGYPSSTPETVVKVLQHEVLLEGLIPDEAYNYRVVSRASPPTISYEHTFAFFEEEVSPPPPTVEGGGGGGSQGQTQAPAVGFAGGGGIALGSGEEETKRNVGGQVSSNESKNLDETSGGAPAIISIIGNESEIGTVEEENGDASSQLAGPIFGLPTNLLFSDSILACLVLSGLAFASIYLMWFIWTLANRKRYTKDDYRRYRRIYYPTALFVVSVIAYIFGVLCVVVPLLIALALSIIWAVLDSRKRVPSQALNA